MIDVSFVREAGPDHRLFFTMAREARRSPEAAVTIALALVEEGLSTPSDALLNMRISSFRQASLPPQVPPLLLRSNTSFLYSVYITWKCFKHLEVL